MAKAMKKFSMVAMAMVMGLTAFLTFDTGKASAGSGCTDRSTNAMTYTYLACASDSGSNVNASIEYVGGSASGKEYWVMALQRDVGSGSTVWSTIGTREGYVSPSSPSYRTFTNVSTQGKRMRLKIIYYRDAAHTQYNTTVYTSTWIR